MELTKANKKRIIFGEAAFAVTKVSFFGETDKAGAGKCSYLCRRKQRKIICFRLRDLRQSSPSICNLKSVI